MSSDPTNDMTRKFFSNREEMLALCEGFSALNPCSYEREDVRRVWSTWRKSAYERAVAIIFRHAASPIERELMCSVLLGYVLHNPTGYDFTPPLRDAPVQIASAHASVAAMVKLGEFLDQHPERRESVMSQLEATGEKDAFIRQYSLGGGDNIVFTPQAAFPNIRVNGSSVRVDLLAWSPAEPKLMVAIECDGFKWHSSKESFTHDRARDRALKANGIETLRFSGSEIHADLKSVSEQVIGYLESTRERFESEKGSRS